ncbi:MAG: SDR family NAD(P)-dependent oxidoreductase [Kiritimatiellia bacterium]
MNRYSLKNKCVMVTGGSRGIGLAIAQACARAGARIALVARNPRTLRQAAATMQGRRTKVDCFSFDMAATDKLEALYRRIIRRTGGVDILVNNAGTTVRGPAETINQEDWEMVLKVNLTSVFRLCQMFARERIARKAPGKLINIASLLSEAARKDNSPYATAKGGIRQLTKALAVDWAKYNINVNAIGPGYIRTELTQPLQDNADFDKWVTARTPLGRWGNPVDIADTAVFLASPASDFITGQVVYVDGGILSSF